MIQFIKKYQKQLGMGLALSMLTICFFQQRELAKLRLTTSTHTKQIDSVITITDSLRDELFIERIDAGRHEVTRDEVLGKYPKAKKEYDYFYNHQTE
jgi:hypothetical protein